MIIHGQLSSSIHGVFSFGGEPLYNMHGALLSRGDIARWKRNNNK
jgi:hypothetical protein